MNFITDYKMTKEQVKIKNLEFKLLFGWGDVSRPPGPVNPGCGPTYRQPLFYFFPKRLSRLA